MAKIKEKMSTTKKVVIGILTVVTLGCAFFAATWFVPAHREAIYERTEISQEQDSNTNTELDNTEVA